MDTKQLKELDNDSNYFIQDSEGIAKRVDFDVLNDKFGNWLIGGKG